MFERKHFNSENIAFFIPSLQAGGAERVMLTLAIGFAEKGVPVDLVLANASGPLIAQVPAIINVVNLGQNQVVRSIPGLVRYLKRRRPLVLLSTMGHANFAAIFAEKLARTNTRLAINVPCTEGEVEGRKIKRGILKYMIKRMKRDVDVVIAVSHGVADDYSSYMNLNKRCIKVIYNPAVRQEIFNLAEEKSSHEWLIKKTSPVVLAVGRLIKSKDYPTLIKAFKIVRREIGARLIILGEGKERALIERIIEEEGLADFISLPGFVANPFSFMKCADVFVLSSKHEGFGLVLAEAMALGTPIVSTDCPGSPAEILEYGKWGKLVPVGNVQVLAHAIIETIRHPVRDAAVERAAAFSVENILHQYASALGIKI